MAALATWGLHAEAVRIAGGEGPVDWGKRGKLKLLSQVAHWVEGAVGPTGVLVAGGALVGLGVFVLFAVLAYPPVRVVVEPAEGG